MRTLRVFLLVGVLGWVVVALSVDAQAPVMCSLRWSVPVSVCADSEACFLRVRPSSNGDLYVWSVRDAVLYVFAAEGAEFTAFDLSAYAALLSGPRADLVPLDDAVLFASFTTQGYLFSRYTFGATLGTMHTVNLPSAYHFAPCDHAATPPLHDFQQVEDDQHVLVCTQTMPARFGEPPLVELRNLDVSALTVSDPLLSVPKSMGETIGLLPWTKVVAGRDGNVYIQVRDRNAFGSVFPRLDRYAENLEIVLRYRPGSTTWDAIGIERPRLSRPIPPESNPALPRLVAVDAASNLYFYTMWYTVGATHVDLTQTNADGEVLWSLTENDLGAGLYWHGLIAPGRFLIAEGTRDGAVLTRIWECAR